MGRVPTVSDRIRTHAQTAASNSLELMRFSPFKKEARDDSRLDTVALPLKLITSAKLTSPLRSGLKHCYTIGKRAHFGERFLFSNGLMFPAGRVLTASKLCLRKKNVNFAIQINIKR